MSHNPIELLILGAAREVLARRFAPLPAVTAAALIVLEENGVHFVVWRGMRITRQ